LLGLVEGVEGAFAGGVGGGDEFGLVGARELTVVRKGVLEDGYDGLLERDDLGLKLIFGDCCDHRQDMLSSTHLCGTNRHLAQICFHIVRIRHRTSSVPSQHLFPNCIPHRHFPVRHSHLHHLHPHHSSSDQSLSAYLPPLFVLS
jgi:hypothetical protein